jgi:hypothetical protein
MIMVMMRMRVPAMCTLSITIMAVSRMLPVLVAMPVMRVIMSMRVSIMRMPFMMMLMALHTLSCAACLRCTRTPAIFLQAAPAVFYNHSDVRLQSVNLPFRLTKNLLLLI